MLPRFVYPGGMTAALALATIALAQARMVLGDIDEEPADVLLMPLWIVTLALATVTILVAAMDWARAGKVA